MMILLVFAASFFGCSCSDDEASSSNSGVSGDDDDSDDDDIGDDDDSTDDDDDDDNDDDDTEERENWRFIRDADGRALIFHGCNFDGNAKSNGLPNRTEAEAEELAHVWGFNFVRYLIFWAMIEPEQGVYDDAYLDAVEDWLDILHQKGLKVVLDMHQDVWGPFISEDWGGVDGAPEWATVTDNWPHIPFSTIIGGWAYDYLSPAVNRAFGNFWDYQRHPELQDHFADMWAYVATRFKDHPAILGYDFINEPWQGTYMLGYKEFDQGVYSDFLQRMIDGVRAVDQDSWLFYEPPALATNQGFPNFLRVLNDPRQGPNRLAFFPHIYSAWIELTGGYDPAVDNALDNWEKHRLADGERQKAPVLSGEWAMLNWHDQANLLLWNKDALAMLERATSGWAYWDCNFFFNNPVELQKMLGSIYPRAVAGYPISYGYDSEAGEFTLVFEHRQGVTGPTEIYLPEERNFPGGWTLEVSDAPDTWESEFDQENNLLKVWTNDIDQEHTISIFASN